MLNPQSPLPLYHQLSDHFTEQIRSGTYKPGEAIPSETEIAKQYTIGRPTVRQAMELLVRKGLVERKRGSGTFVKEQVCQVDLFSLAGTSQAFSTKGINTSSKIIHPLSIEEIIDEKSNPFDGTRAFFLSRLTLVRPDSLLAEPLLNEVAVIKKRSAAEKEEDRAQLQRAEPVLLEEIYLRPDLFPGLDKLDLEDRSLSQVISDQYYLKPETGRQSFKISFLSEQKGALLELKPSDPILEVERRLNFPGAEDAIFSRLYCKTERFAFSQTIGMDGS